MRVVVASDSFKGTFSAARACEAIAAGVLAAEPTAEVLIRPMADGGEGTLEALSAAWGVPVVEVPAVDAIGRPTRGRYAMHDATAVVELASANGLPGVSDVALRPRAATTRGTGQVLRAALEAGAREVLLCVGGSASTDGGSGILTELGVRLLDADDQPVADGGAGLAAVARADLGGLHPAARDARWRIAVDVTNPLTGPTGAAAVYGPQKGASPADVAFLDAALTRWAAVLAGQGHDIAALPGAGAAGGVPAGLALLGATWQPGASLVADAIGLAEACRGADLVITGEGRFDAQSLSGKVVAGVIAAAGPVPVAVVAGQIGMDERAYRAAGISAARATGYGPDSLLSQAAQSVFSDVFGWPG
ncbi:MAG: glycerate kinase [Propionibacteriaceae bacterium]|nr:glycerate kinase [Propionibacteriaceae bacterium]